MHLLAAKDLGPYLTVLGLMILLLVVATAGILWFRARILARAQAESDHQASLLKNLRAMRDRGEITLEEYDSARRAMASRLAGRPVTAGGATSAPAAQVARRPAAPAGEGEELRARPGYDLTGRPLPKPGAGGPGAGASGSS
jgi:hypothetical protein